MNVILTAVLALAVGAPAGFASIQDRPLAPRHQAWLEDEVADIITFTERDAFLRLETDADRDRLIEEFWRRRDPTPDMPRNEYREEHYRRLEFADKTFGLGAALRGRKSQRGRIYIALGPPLEAQRFRREGFRQMELWTIQGNPAVGRALFFRLLFYQRDGAGDFVLYNPVFDSPKHLALNPLPGKTSSTFPRAWDDYDIGVFLLLEANSLFEVASAVSPEVPGLGGALSRVSAGSLGAEIGQYLLKKIDDSYTMAIREHKPIPEARTSVKLVAGAAATAILDGADGRTFLHFALAPEALTFERFGDRCLANLRLTVCLADASGATVFEHMKTIPLELRPEELKSMSERAFQLQDAVPVIPGAWTLSLRLENTISNEYATAEKTIEVPASREPAMSPLILARKIFAEAPEGAAAGAFQVGRAQVYPSVDNLFPKTEGFFAFLQLRGLTASLKEKGALIFTLTGDGRALWTSRKALRDCPDPLAVVESIPTEKLAASTYTLGAALVDGDDRTILASQADLRLAAGSVPGIWTNIQPLPRMGDPAVDFALGVQLLKTGRAAEALTRLAKAASVEPGSVEALNALGDCHAELGERGKALAAWKKSLAIMPDQPRIQALIK
ncbi:MAG: GWxTD domain-containing protein [Candidatus Aminicenantes bacterium]|nr:GWxTD domain-containing protein [Candidatus Aminicenantes bacterium]